MPYPHDPGTLDAPTTATESGVNKYCQWLCLIGVVSGKLSKISHLSGAGGIRTPYLLTASQTFSQLNYSPIKPLSNLAENNQERKPKVNIPGN